MNAISLLHSQLEQARMQLGFPEIKSSLKPVFQDRGWIISADICLLLARRLAQGPDTLAERFLTHLVDSHAGKWSRIAGYLVFTPSGSSEFYAEFQASYSSALPLRIFVPKRDIRHSAAGYVRLASLAILEAMWAIKQRVPVELVIAEVSFIDALRLGDPLQTFLGVVKNSQNAVPNHSHNTDNILSFIEQDNQARYSVFLPPGDIDPTLFKKGAALLSFDEQVSVTIPEQGWMSELDSLPSDFSFLEDGKDGAYSLLLHLASSSRGVDIEWHSAQFSERKNLCWLLRSSMSRLQSLSDWGRAAMSCQSRELPQSPCSLQISAENNFIVRFLPLFYDRAIFHGEVSALVAAATSVSDLISTTLNSPDFRMRLESGDLSASHQFMALMDHGRLLSRIFFDVD